jgi:two-component system chemotaxis response regulator CheB
MSEMDRLGKRSPLTCPDCQGVMWKIDDGDLIRYRCHVGHAYTAELMSLALDENLRRALASAVRGLEERLALAEKLQTDAEERQRPTPAATWRRRVTEYQQNLDVIRGAIRRMEEFRAHGTDHNVTND